MVAIPRPISPLHAALRSSVAGEVRFDVAARAAYASDASNYRQVPVGVVLPRTLTDVVAAVSVCRSHGAAILPRGAGTSMCGQSVNAAVVIAGRPTLHLAELLAQHMRAEPALA